jgi:hypothetical protein
MCAGQKPVNQVSIYIHLMVISPFIILMLCDLKFQPVSDAVKQLHLCYYN